MIRFTLFLVDIKHLDLNSKAKYFSDSILPLPGENSFLFIVRRVNLTSLRMIRFILFFCFVPMSGLMS